MEQIEMCNSSPTEIKETSDGWESKGFSSKIVSKYKFYEKYYQLVIPHTIVIGIEHFLGKKDNRSCRYCRKTVPETTFNKKAHAISQLVGNTTIFSYDECDICNTYFDEECENHLANYLGMYRSINPVKGKNGYIKTVRGSHSSVQYESDSILSVVNDIKRPIAKIDRSKGQIELKCKKGRYKPIRVYATLLKFFISLLPDTLLSEVNQMKSWLMDLKDSCNTAPLLPIMIFHSSGFGTYEKTVFGAKLLRTKKQCKYPRYSFIFEFFGAQFQIFIPADSQVDSDMRYPMSFPFYGIVSNPSMVTNEAHKDFSSSKTVDEENEYLFIID